MLSPLQDRRLIPSTPPHCNLLQALSPELRVLRFPVESISVSKKYRILGSFPIPGWFLFTCGYLFAVVKYVISKTFDKEIWGGTKPQWSYSGFLVTEMIEGFVGFEIFDSRILLG